MIVVEVYNEKGILLDIINNVTEPGAVLAVDIDWEKIGGVVSGELTISPNYIYSIAVNAEIVIRWTLDSAPVDTPAEFLTDSIAAYIVQIPEFKVNSLVKVRFAGYWKKLENICAVPTYTVGTPPDEEVRNGYEEYTIKEILLDLFERNIQETFLMSSAGIIQRNKPTTDTAKLKVTVEPGDNILAGVTLQFQDGVTSAAIGTQLTSGQTYFLNYVVSTNTLTYVSPADYPITNSLSQSTAGIINAPETAVLNFVVEDMKLTDVLTKLVDMANIDYHKEQWVCYVNNSRELVFEELEVKEYLHEGTDFHRPDISQTAPTINKVTLYTKDKDNSERTVYRGYVQNTDSISKYGVKSKPLVFTLEEGDQAEILGGDQNAILYMAKMLISKNSVPQTEITIDRIQRILSHGKYSITTQQVLGLRTVLEGDSLDFAAGNENIPGQWNLAYMTNTTPGMTRDKYLYGQASIKFELSANSIYDFARYNFPSMEYAIQRFTVWVYLEGTAQIEVQLVGALVPISRTITTQNQWVQVDIEPSAATQDSIVYLGAQFEEFTAEEYGYSDDGITTGDMLMSDDGIATELFGQAETPEIVSGLLEADQGSGAEPITIFDTSQEGAFLYGSSHFIVKLLSGTGNVYIDKAEVVATRNYTGIESLEKQSISIGNGFLNKINLGARPSSLIDEVDKGAEQGESAYDMYKGVTKTL